MSNPLVSIIVPTYNVERYVEECIESLLNQTYDATEIIVIDDGSTDATVYLLQQYADKINLVAHTNNKGQGARRNEGIKQAQGKYLYFVDSDDWVEPDTLEKTVAQLEKTGADLIRFNGAVFYEGDTALINEGRYTFSEHLKEHKVYLQEEALQSNRKTYSASPCLYVVKKEVIDTYTLYFLEGVLHEDEYFTTRLFTVIESMVYLNQAFYHRRYRTASTMTENSNAHKLRSFNSYLEVFLALEEVYTDQELTELQKAFIKRQLLSIYNGLLISSDELNRKNKLKDLESITVKDRLFLAMARIKYIFRK